MLFRSYRLWPHRDSCAGGFAAALQLDESSPSLARLSQDESSRFTKKSKTTHNRSETNRFRKPKNEKNRRDDCSRGNTRSRTDRSGGNLSPNLDLVGKLSIPFFQSESYWYGFETGVQSWIEECELHPEHRIQTAMPKIATSKAQSIEPYHSLAMLAPNLFTAANTIQLNDAQAWRYLEGLTLERDGLATTTPWSIATWNSKPLGWLKAAPNRWNNYLPAWARFSGPANGSSPDGTIQAPES